MNLIRIFWQSQIGKKIVMAITGLIGVGFVIGHMVGNLQVFESAEKINAYGKFLHHTVGLELWAVRAGLLAAVLLHIWAAWSLTRQANAARPEGYQRRSPQVSTLASRTMRWGGVLLLVFIVLHILHFTVRSFPGYQGTVTIDGVQTVDVYTNLITAFSSPLWVLFYVVAMGALALHLYHGVWSSVRTLGAAKPSTHPLRRTVALVLAALIAIGFVAVPIGVYLGFARAEPAATAAR
jgi:succinate dehydrogenase / fumarate reductase, cytochrome b subunit